MHPQDPQPTGAERTPDLDHTPAQPDVDAHLRFTEPPHTHPAPQDRYGNPLPHQDHDDDAHARAHAAGVPHTHAPVATPRRSPSAPLRIGIGGPVGSGKTALVAALCRALGPEGAGLDMAVVTNDIYTTEDGDFLVRHGVLPAERITAVQTGACPHTAIRDDIAMNLDAVEELEDSFHPDVVLVESGGDNLTATFSYGLVDAQIFVVDVAGGDKVPRKGGPGVITSDLLVINKTDLAPLVGADLGVMDRDASALRGERPVAFTSLREDPGATPVAAWVRQLLAQRRELAAASAG
ncbi:urease accessory protein UreG [Streptomyces sp. NP160]|uniref:urease accessory protein UreG n=1 Tax=Streptomyces sp. NP160 TaxID=2586637 RepID=UPI00214C3807|nr:urease accessory protein UreG [Streptomyces sp. NP160]